MMRFQKNILLKNYSSYRIGGRARYFFEARNLEEIGAALRHRQRLEEEEGIEIPFFVLGGGTNILFSDRGFPGLVLKINIDFIRFTDGGLIEVGAGTSMQQLVRATAQNSLAGLEWAAGLPGTVGGAVRGNAGAFGSEMKDAVVDVLSIDVRRPDQIIRRSNTDCCFAYRSSIFKEADNREIIIGAVLRFAPGKREMLLQKINEYIDYRRLRQPLEYPSAGSVFKNVPWEKLSAEHQEFFYKKKKNDPFPVVPAVCLIAEAGLRGRRCGGAEISEKHPNFIINKNNASANDVLSLIRLVKKVVGDKFGIGLEEEIKIFDDEAVD